MNLKGDLTFTSSNTLRASSTATPTTTTNFNFIGSGDGSTADTTQTISIASSAATENNGINFRVINGTGISYVKLINQNLELGNNGPFTVNSGNTLDFGFDGAYSALTNTSAGTTGLEIKEVPATATGTGFTANGGSILKISSAAGMMLAGNDTGNVRTDNRIYTPTGSTYHYIGKANQNTGNHFASTTNTKRIICDLDTTALTLTLDVPTGTSNELYIKKGSFVALIPIEYPEVQVH